MSTHEYLRLQQEGASATVDAYPYGYEGLPGITDLNAPILINPGDYGRLSLAAFARDLAEPVYMIAFKYPKKINDEDVFMQFMVSGFRSGLSHDRTEQIQDAFGDTHKLLVHRQLSRDELEACGELALRPHNGIYAAPLNRGGAVYMHFTKNDEKS